MKVLLSLRWNVINYTIFGRISHVDLLNQDFHFFNTLTF